MRRSPSRGAVSKAFAGLFPLLLASSAVLAQEANDSDLEELVQLLNTPVVSASKSAQSLSRAAAKIVVLTAADIRVRGYVGLDEIFHDLAGMDISKGQGVEWSTVFMRGIRTENTDRFLLIWDGVIQNDLWKYNAWISRQYPLSNVERIEVMYGPSSLLYGANAFAGIINVILKKPADQNGGVVQVVGGAFDTRLGEASFGKVFGDFRVAATARWFTSDEMDPGDASWVDNGGRRRYYGFDLARDGLRDPAQPSGYAAGLKVAGGVPRVRVDGRDEPFDGRPGGDTKDWFAQASLGYGGWDLSAFYWYRQETEDLWYVPLRRMHAPWTPTGSAITLSQTSRFGPAVELKSYVRTAHTGLDEDRSYEPAFTRNITNDRGDPGNLKVSSLGSVTFYKLANREWRTGQQVNVTAKDLDLVGGWEYTAVQSYEDYSTRTLLADPWRFTPQHSERNLAAFLNVQVNPSKAFSLAAGLRYDYNYLAGEDGGFGHLFTGRLAGIYSIGEKHRFKLIYGQAFQAPSPWHKFATIAGERDLPNPFLRPERLASTELVYELLPSSRWRLSLSVYYSMATDLIVAVPVPYGTGTTLQHQNTGGLEIFGQELEARYFLDARSSLWANVTTSSTKVTATGDTQGDLAPFKANAGADLLLRSKWGISVRCHYVSARDTVNRGSTNLYTTGRVDPYVTMDVVLSWLDLLPGTDLRGSVYNVFDQEYFDPGLRAADGKTYNPVIIQPGARGYLGVAYRF